MSYLDKVIGHKFQKEQLLRQFHSGTLPHALLFCGDAGIGKRLLALRFAQDILCRGVSTFADLSAVALAKAEAALM